MHAGEPSLHAQWRAAALMQVDALLTHMHDPFVSQFAGHDHAGGFKQ